MKRNVIYLKKKRHKGGSNPSVHRLRGTWYNQHATKYHTFNQVNVVRSK